LEQQKKEKPGASKDDDDGLVSGDDADDIGVELGLTARRRKTDQTD
jgi:hypothetical protein